MPDPRRNTHHRLAEKLRLLEINPGETQADARIKHCQPLHRVFAILFQRFVQQIKELLVPGQFLPVVRQPVLIPLAGKRQLAFRNHRIDKKDQRQLNFPRLGREPHVRCGPRHKVLEQRLNLRARHGVIQICTARGHHRGRRCGGFTRERGERGIAPARLGARSAAGDAVEPADVLEQRFCELEQCHVLVAPAGTVM